MPLLRTDDWTLNSSIDTNKGKYPSLSFPPVIAEDGAEGGGAGEATQTWVSWE